MRFLDTLKFDIVMNHLKNVDKQPKLNEKET